MNGTTDVSVEKWDIVNEVDCPVSHGFADGVYLREIFMPKGTYVIGKEHTTQHFNIVLKGQAYVMMNDTVELITAPTTFVSSSGTRKVLYVLEDMIWQTVHTNEENTKDIETIENRLATDTPLDRNILLSPKEMIEIGGMV